VDLDLDLGAEVEMESESINELLEILDPKKIDGVEGRSSPKFRMKTNGRHTDFRDMVHMVVGPDGRETMRMILRGGYIPNNKTFELDLIFLDEMD